MKHLAFLAALLASPATADCPPVSDISAEIDALVADVQAAESSDAARVVSGRMWTLWTKAPDARAQGLLDDGMARRAAYDLAGAIEIFDDLVAYCPAYAEGYNQRAFANFLREDYAAALPDLNRAIELQPRHIPALSGKGLTLIGMGRVAEGQEVIRKALGLNPWLNERQYLSLKAEGTEL